MSRNFNEKLSRFFCRERGWLVRVGVQASACPPENKLKLGLQLPSSKIEGQVKLKNFIGADGIDIGDVLVAPAGAEIVVDAAGVAVAKGGD